jgi:hypothetical protein
MSRPGVGLESVARDEAGVAVPIASGGTLCEQLLEGSEDRPELAVVDPDDDRQAGMAPRRLRPAAGDVGEVLDVEGDQDAFLDGGQRQQRLVIPAVQVTLLVDRADVVSPFSQGARDAGPRDVGVKQQPHRALSLAGRVDGDERILGAQLRKWAAIERDRRLDLLRKALRVGERKPNRSFAQAPLRDHLANRPEVTVGVDHLPDVERRPDHPGPPIPIVAAEGDAGEHPRPQRLFGEPLDHRALAAMRAPRLGGDQLVGVRGDADAQGLGLGGHEGSVTRQLRCNLWRDRVAVCAIAILAAAALWLPASAQAAFGFAAGPEGFSATVTGEGGALDTEAGSHPVALTMSVGFNQAGAFADGDLKDLSLALPPGLIENPTAVPVCSQAAFQTPRQNPFEESAPGEKSLSGENCPDNTQVGTLTERSSHGGGETRTFGLFNLQPPPGTPSELGANPYGAPIVFAPSIRQAEGEYGLTLHTRDVSQLLSIEGLELSIWGTPWNILHNAQRGNCLNEAEPGFGWAKCSVGRPSKTPTTSYLTLPTSCEGPLGFGASADSWQQPATASRTVQGPTLEGCASLPFEPGPSAQLSDPRASSPSGYEFDINVDTSGVTDPKRLAPSPVRKAVVTLPEGVTINPSVGSGLGVCTTAQYEAETPTSPPGAGCPNEAKIGDFTVTSPLIAGRIEGALFLAAPHENPFGSLISIYLVAKSIDRGILVKVAGELKADPTTGRLTASFERLPQIPYSQLAIHFREGQRSPLATPPACGAIATGADLTPWRDASLVRHFSLPAAITSGVGGGPCPTGTPPFAPQASGGTLNSHAGSYTPFYLRLTRTDAEQEITSYSATLPPGLLGKIAGVPYCPEAAIAAAAANSGVAERDHPSCPAASLIGHTTAGYGVGSVLTYAPGKLYLAGPYRGSSFSVVAIDSALVGPFDLGVVIVRSAIRIDPTTAQASIDATGTDPIPHIIDGIPIHLRDIRAYIDKPNFTLNPTSCAVSTLASALNGSGQRFGDPADDTLATATVPFQAFDCGSLAFKPKLSLRLKGGTKRGDHPSLRVVVKPRPGDANIASTQVTLPPSLFLDQTRIKSICTRVQFAAQHCPPESIYGHAKAITPLLGVPLEGPVYLRSSENTLPDLVFALKGQGIEIDLAGRIDSVKGGIRGSFETIPDAPVSSFSLTMDGGKQGILVDAANLCAETQPANVRMIGHNNRGVLMHPVLRVSCKKHKAKHKKKKGSSR